MLQSQFETHTDIFPDVLLYDAADHEYMSGEWESKAQFCHAFKFNEDGLAEKCRKAANERYFALSKEADRLRSEITPLADRCEKLTAENNRLKDENENLRNEIAALSDRVDELNDDVEELQTATLEVTEPEITIQSIRAAMQQALTDAACDDNKADMILHSVWAYDYLLERFGSK